MYRQILDANWRIPYVGTWCEGYVEGCWGQATLPTINNQRTSGVYGNAVSPVNPGETGKWVANPGNGNHPGELPPAGVTVPVYFSLGSTRAGHTAVALSDEQIACSAQPGFHEQGFIYPNLQSMIDDYAKYNNGCTYLGWSEYVGNIKVVELINQGGEEMTAITPAQVDSNYLLMEGHVADAEGHAIYDGKDYAWATEDMKTYIANNGLGCNSALDKVNDLQGELSTEQTKDAGLAQNVSGLNLKLNDSVALNKDLQAQLDAKTSIIPTPIEVPPVSEPTATPKTHWYDSIVNAIMKLFK
jgi:hypothetical protein